MGLVAAASTTGRDGSASKICLDVPTSGIGIRESASTGPINLFVLIFVMQTSSESLATPAGNLQEHNPSPR